MYFEIFKIVDSSMIKYHSLRNLILVAIMFVFPKTVHQDTSRLYSPHGKIKNDLINQDGRFLHDSI